MVEHSLSDGALDQFRDPLTGEGDTDAVLTVLTVVTVLTVLTVLKTFWTAVAATFPEEWKQPSRRSMLMQG